MDLVFTDFFFLMCPPSLPAKKQGTKKILFYQYLLSNLFISYATPYEIMNKSFVFCKYNQKPSKINFYKHSSKLNYKGTE